MSKIIIRGSNQRSPSYDGYCILMSEIAGDKRYCTHKEYYKGNPDDNSEHIKQRIEELLEPESMDDLRDGLYSIECHPAFFEVDDWDHDASQVIERVRFTLQRKIEVTRNE
jgi:hypothetical protein